MILKRKKILSIKTSYKPRNQKERNHVSEKVVKIPFRQHSNTDEAQRRYLMHLTR